jgi:hypothetical protein
VSRCRAARDAWGRVGSHRGSPLRRFNGRGIEIKVSGPTAASELEGSLGKPPAGQHAPPVQDRKTQTQVQLVSSALSSAWPANCSQSPSSVFAISSHHRLPPLLPPHSHRIPSLSPPPSPPSPTISHTNCKSQPSSCIAHRRARVPLILTREKFWRADLELLRSSNACRQHFLAALSPTIFLLKPSATTQ